MHITVSTRTSACIFKPKKRAKEGRDITAFELDKAKSTCCCSRLDIAISPLRANRRQTGLNRMSSFIFPRVGAFRFQTGTGPTLIGRVATSPPGTIAIASMWNGRGKFAAITCHRTSLPNSRTRVSTRSGAQPLYCRLPVSVGRACRSQSLLRAQNNTGQSPNRQLHQLGLILNLWF